MCNVRTIFGGLSVSQGHFCVRDVCTISLTTKWGLSGFFRFLCAQCMYHIWRNLRVLWDIFVCAMYIPFHQLSSVGLSSFYRFHVHDVRTIFGGLSVSLVYFRVHDVQTMLTDNSGAH